MSGIMDYESTTRIENEDVGVNIAEHSVPAQGEGLGPEVRPKPKRKNLTTQYKLKILAESDRLRGSPGRIAALLRREGLYASHLSNWRRLRQSGAYAALSSTRGRKPDRDEKDREIERLCKELDKATTWRRHAELIMDAQKKIALLLGNPIQEETLPRFPNLDLDKVNS
jgi:transposase